jgi:hypothetical protein
MIGGFWGIGHREQCAGAGNGVAVAAVFHALLSEGPNGPSLVLSTVGLRTGVAVPTIPDHVAFLDGR